MEQLSFIPRPVSFGELVEYLQDKSIEYRGIAEYKSIAYHRAANSLHSSHNPGDVAKVGQDFTQWKFIGPHINQMLKDYVMCPPAIPNKPIRIGSDEVAEIMEELAADWGILSTAELREVGKKYPAVISDEKLEVLNLRRKVIFDQAIKWMEDSSGLDLYLVGSARRGHELVKDLDFVCTDPVEKIDETLGGLSKATHGFSMSRTNNGRNMVRYAMETGPDVISVDIKVVDHDSLPTAALYLTGPTRFNIKMRSLAKSRGLLLNEYGLWNGNVRVNLPSEGERSVFKILGVDYLNPEEREEVMQ